MPSIPFPILALTHRFEDGKALSQALFFPELNRFEANDARAITNLRNSLLQQMADLDPLEFHRRRAPSEVTVATVRVSVPAPKQKMGWRAAVDLSYFIALWRTRNRFHAFVPSLHLELVGDSEAELLRELPEEILGHLRRLRKAESLEALLATQQATDLVASSTTVELDLLTPKQRAIAVSSDGPKPEVLSKAATQLRPDEMPNVFEVESLVERLAELLVGSQARGVLLVGPSGVGKTAIVKALIKRRQSFQLSATPFWETNGARLMVGADAFGDWQQRCQQVVQEAKATRAVLLLGNLFELAEVARHATTPQGMAGFFRQSIERGELLCVVECTPEQRDLLERDHPQLLRAFSTLSIPTPSSSVCRSILAQAHPKLPLSVSDLTERLHRRYARYSAQPGRSLLFLERLARHKPHLDDSAVAEAFAAESGMPRMLVDDSLPLDLQAAHHIFTREVLGQSRAVDLVIDLLASVKAGLTPEGRPIASLLFIGPTGVGKTEMAKALAQFLFSDRHRVTRFDMSEYSDPYAVERLTAGQEGGQGLLTSKVREQPFSVVLFDELEKADPSFFDLLLQILGEGRLTDAHGRTADFTNSVIVMTSNLGAATFSKGPLGLRTGEHLPEQAEQEFTRAVKAAFRPELFNRIDRLVPFAPLDRETATRVTERELERMVRREAFLSGSAHLTVSPDVAAHLASLGYDRRYGARPLRRSLERALLGPLARALATSGERSLKVAVEVQGGELRLASQTISEPSSNQTALSELACRGMELRRAAQKISDGRQAQTLRNQIQRLKKLQERSKKNPHLEGEQLEQLSSLPSRLETLGRLERAYEQSHQLESQALAIAAGYAEADSTLGSRLAEGEKHLGELALALYASNFDTPEKATVVIYREKNLSLHPLVEAYLKLWTSQKWNIQGYRISLGARETEEQKDDPVLRLAYDDELENRALWCTPVRLQELFTGQAIGLAFELKGPLALPWMLCEAGLHVFGTHTFLQLEVLTLPQPLAKYEPPSGLHLRKSLAGPPRRRVYNSGHGFVEDLRLERRKTWHGKSLEAMIEEFTRAELTRVSLEACS